MLFLCLPQGPRVDLHYIIGAIIVPKLRNANHREEFESERALERDGPYCAVPCYHVFHCLRCSHWLLAYGRSGLWNLPLLLCCYSIEGLLAHNTKILRSWQQAFLHLSP